MPYRMRGCQLRAPISTLKKNHLPLLSLLNPALLPLRGECVLVSPTSLSAPVVTASFSRDGDQESGISKKQWKKAIMLVWRHAAQHK